MIEHELVPDLPVNNILNTKLEALKQCNYSRLSIKTCFLPAEINTTVVSQEYSSNCFRVIAIMKVCENFSQRHKKLEVGDI